MPRKGQLVIRIIGDDRDVNKTFSRVEGNVRRFGGNIVSAGKNFAVFGGAAVGATALVGKQVLAFGGQLEAMDSKANTVFGGQVGRVRAWAKANARDMGLTTTELTGLAANFGDLLVPMGFTRKSAADMSKDVIGLSGALAEWSGGTRSASEVSEILAKAMLGERESLKELGISITEADVQQRLLEKGQKDLSGTALQQAKAIATQELIFEKSRDAQERYAKGGAKTLRTQAHLSASFKTIRDTVVRAALPVIQKVAEWMADKLPGAFDKARQLAAEWGPKIAEVFDKVKQVVGDAVAVLVRVFNTIKPVLTAVLQVFKGVFKAILGVWDFFVAIFRADWKSAWNAIKAIFSGVWEAIRGLAKAGWNLVKRAIMGGLRVFRKLWDIAWDGVKSAFSAIWSGIKNIAAGAWDWIGRNVLRPMLNVINEVIKGLNLINPLGDIPQISVPREWNIAPGRDLSQKEAPPGRHAGGPVSARRPYIVGERGPELFVPGSGGVVHPNAAAGGGVTNIVINVRGSVLTEDELGDVVRRALLRRKRQTGSLGLA